MPKRHSAKIAFIQIEVLFKNVLVFTQHFKTHISVLVNISYFIHWLRWYARMMHKCPHFDLQDSFYFLYQTPVASIKPISGILVFPLLALLSCSFLKITDENWIAQYYIATVLQNNKIKTLISAMFQPMKHSVDVWMGRKPLNSTKAILVSPLLLFTWKKWWVREMTYVYKIPGLVLWISLAIGKSCRILGKSLVSLILIL